MLTKPANTLVPIDPLLAKRWSSRAIDANKFVSREQILSLLEAARWAPSCYADEPWRLLVCDKATHPEAWEKAFACLAESNQAWVKNAPLLIVAAANPRFRHNGEPNRWAFYDVGGACENLCLQAASLGLTTHQMGGFDVAKAHAAFNIPEDVDCAVIIAVGYQTEAEILSEPYYDRELATRTRQPLESNCFEGSWGNAFAK